MHMHVSCAARPTRHAGLRTRPRAARETLENTTHTDTRARAPGTRIEPRVSTTTLTLPSRRARRTTTNERAAAEPNTNANTRRRRRPSRPLAPSGLSRPSARPPVRPSRTKTQRSWAAPPSLTSPPFPSPRREAFESAAARAARARRARFLGRARPCTGHCAQH